MPLLYSIGDIVDRLIISDLKHWHLEEEIAELSAKIKAAGDDASKEDIKKLSLMFESSTKMNQYRQLVIEAINEFFGDLGKREDRSE